MFKDPILNQKLKEAKKIQHNKRRNKNIITSAGLRLFKRHSKAYVIWRKYILKKFNYKCYWCGDNRGLNVHHIQEWSKNKKLRVDKRNGVVLCGACHILIHPYMDSYYYKLNIKS